MTIDKLYWYCYTRGILLDIYTINGRPGLRALVPDGRMFFVEFDIVNAYYAADKSASTCLYRILHEHIKHLKAAPKKAAIYDYIKEFIHTDFGKRRVGNYLIPPIPE